MGQIVSGAVEAYLASLNRTRDPLLDEIAGKARARGLPVIDAEVGLFLHVLARTAGARRILEIGTAIGYSTIWLGRALPAAGLLLSIEIDAERAAEARDHLARAGLESVATVLVGDAAWVLRKVAGPFDLIFNDGDKRQYSPLLDRLVERLRPGGLLVTDNVLWDGEVVPGFVATPARPADLTRAIAAFNEQLAADARLLTSIVPLRDGLAVSLRVAPASEAGPGPDA